MQTANFIKAVVIVVLASSLLSCNAEKKTILVVGVLNAPLSLKAWKIRDGVSTVIGNQIHRGLIRIDPSNGNYLGAAAKTWEFVKGKSWIRFQLDRSMHFHDNTKLTCKAVKDSFERLTSIQKDTTILFPKGTLFECESDSTFIIRPPFVSAQLLDILASPAASVVKEDGIIGLGPYKLESSSSSEVKLHRFSGDGPREIHFLISDHETLIKKFVNKEVDDLLYLGLFINVDVPCKHIEGLSPTSFWFGINGKNWGFTNRENRLTVQRLLRLAIRKYPIFQTEIRDESLIPFGVTGNRHPGADDLDHQIADAISTLIPLVKKFGKIQIALRKIQETAYNWNGLLKTADPMSEIFEVNFMNNKEFFDSYYGNKLSVFFIGGNITRNDPFEVLSFFRSKDFINQFGVTESVVDELMDKSFNATTSDEVRQYAQQANDWIISNGYALPLFSKRFNGCVQPYLTGYNLSPLGPLSLDYSSVRLGND